jgi:2-keto-3-deoxy-L-rhamnonate aldolase RhmA
MEGDGLALGMYAGALRGTEIVEIIGLAGFDAVFIDMEHMPVSLREVQTMAVAAKAAGISPFVRTPSLDPPLIARLLDIGVEGIHVPGINGRQDAEAAVAAVRYPPLGRRGILAYSRAAQYGRVPVHEHIERANAETVLALMIETRAAVDAIDDIAAVDGVDLLAVGPEDLAWSLGLADEGDGPRLQEVISRIASRARDAGRRLAVPLNHPVFRRTAVELRAMGVAYANCGPPPERVLLETMAAQVVSVRASLN